VADILFDGLPVLDLLEITPSTSTVAQITQRDQSSISRIYRQVSRRLGLNFRKHADGRYRAGSNQELLKGLRLSSQWLRLQGNPAEPRWLACGHAGPLMATHQPTLVQRCGDPQRLEWLIGARVLDLVVLTRAAQPAATNRPAWMEMPLLSHPDGVDLIVVRTDLVEQPVLQELIATIRRHYRQHLQQHQILEWLG
jgi:hypothetical protein